MSSLLAWNGRSPLSFVHPHHLSTNKNHGLLSVFPHRARGSGYAVDHLRCCSCRTLRLVLILPLFNVIGTWTGLPQLHHIGHSRRRNVNTSLSGYSKASRQDGDCPKLDSRASKWQQVVSKAFMTHSRDRTGQPAHLQHLEIPPKNPAGRVRPLHLQVGRCDACEWGKDGVFPHLLGMPCFCNDINEHEQEMTRACDPW